MMIAHDITHNGLAIGEGGGSGAFKVRTGRMPNAGGDVGRNRSSPRLLSACYGAVFFMSSWD